MERNITSGNGKTGKITYMIPVTYGMTGHVPVCMDEGTSPEEALQWAKDHSDQIKLPNDAEYLEDSFQIDEEGVIYDNAGNAYTELCTDD